MKKVLRIAGLALLTSCGSWVRIGDLTMVANRNIDDSKEYVVVAREVEGVSKKTEQDAMEKAIDNLTKEYKAEFLRNVKIYVKSNGKKVKVVGDAYGIIDTNVNVDVSVNKSVELKIGDSVVFRKNNKPNGKLISGKLIGFDGKNVIVEYDNGKKIQLPFDAITKTGE